MRKKLASFMNSKYILIGLSALCLLFIATSFFTDKLTTPLRNAISTVVIPVQRGMNYIGLYPTSMIPYRKSAQCLKKTKTYRQRLTT